jgi:hypothetical protein
MGIPLLPRWLADEPQIQSLLHAVLDRFDQQPGEARRQRLYFSAEKYLPALKRLDDEADQLWRLVTELERHQLLTINEGKRGPYDAEWKGARLAFTPDSENTLRSWLERPYEEPALHGWRETAKKHRDKFPHGIEPILKRRIAIPGWDDEQVITALAKLGEVDSPHTLRQLSALLFGGDSKRLDEREELVCALFPGLPLKPRALVIAVHIPTECRGVLFIENQDTYALALAGALHGARDLALVYAAGFRGGAERIRDREAALLHYHGKESERSPFESWWFDSAASPPGPVYFFGDLDFSGMAILAALRQRFGAVTAWQPGYASLLERLHNGHGHTADAANKQQQIDPGMTGCEYADNVLLPAARRYGFIDQEAITS